MTNLSPESTLAAQLVAIDSRSFVSNLAVADAVEAALPGFEIERLDYVDLAGVAKRALVAHRGPPGGIAFSGHMDTVPDTGWTDDPWAARIEGGMLRGLGSTDMKGPLAACIVAARSLPPDLPATLLVTTDEETSKEGARTIVARSELARRARPAGIIVAEPTRLVPVRGHRSNVSFTVVATGVQAHSATGRGRNANWALPEFLLEMKALYGRLRSEPSMQDAAYDPPFSDFNLVIDNHGTAVNVTVPTATVRIKYRRSASIDATPVIEAVRAAAERAGLALTMTQEGAPPELPVDHPLVRMCAEATGQSARTAPYGTDASQLQEIAPCVILGPGDIAEAHRPGESVCLADLAAAVTLFQDLARRAAAG
jgi:acetylornithine deacetylase